jgi:hypothetical protein
MRRKLIMAVLLVAAPLALLAGYYIAYEQMSRSLVFDRGIYYETANSIKHAYAASQLFDVLDSVMDAQAAEDAVVALGKFNERLEQVVRRPKDSAAESAKDLWNNQIGITAARWRSAQHSGMSRLELMIKLAELKALRGREADVRTSPEMQTLKGQQAAVAAIVQFDAERQQAIDSANKALATLKP